MTVLRGGYKMKRVLIVDDDKVVAKIIGKRLGETEINITVAEDALQATYEIVFNDFDLIVLDLMLPAEDGF